MLRFLFDAKNYVAQIEFLHQKALEKNRLYKDADNAESLLNLFSDRARVAKLLAQQMKQSTYQFTPPVQRYVWVKDKYRLVYVYGLIDKVVLGTIGQWLAKILEPHLSASCCGFRRHYNCHKVIKRLSEYLKAHCSQPVFFYKTDVTNYSESIPVDSQSLLWGKLDELLMSAGVDQQSYIGQLIFGLVRPVSINLDRFQQSNLVGIATGSSLTAVMSNLYLSSLDHELSEIPGVFHVRFGDDVFICHTELSLLKKAKETVHTQMQLLGLSLKKDKDLFGAFGHQNDEGLKNYHSINYLGYKLHYSGLYSFSTSQQRKLLHRVYLSIDNVVKTNRQLSGEVLGKHLCQQISHLLIHSETTYLNRNIYMATNDHGQLKRMDFLIALHVAEKISGINGVKAFRKVPYKKIRQQWRLVSLCYLRNHSKDYYAQLKSLVGTQAEIA